MDSGDWERLSIVFLSYYFTQVSRFKMVIFSWFLIFRKQRETTSEQNNLKYETPCFKFNFSIICFSVVRIRLIVES